jgi:dimethylglycine dehydrogenase
MRLEKVYKGYAAEMTNEITMIEADMERFCRFDKEDFIGKAATLQRKQDGVSQQLVYCELDPGDSDARGGEAVMAGDQNIGITTSGGYGHRTGKSLVFAYVKPEFVAPGTTFDVLVLGRVRKATVLAESIYDAGNGRLRR